MLSFGVHGTQTILLQTISDYLHSMEYSIDFNPLVSRNLLDQVDKSRLVELRLIKKRVRKDVADQVYNGPVDDLTEQRVYKIKRKGTITIPDSLRDLLDNHDTQYYEIFGEQFDEIKSIVKESGSNMTLTFCKHDSRFRETMIIEKDIKKVNGHPVFDELLILSRTYMKRLKSLNGESSET